MCPALKSYKGSTAPAWDKAKKSDRAAIAERELSGSGWLPDIKLHKGLWRSVPACDQSAARKELNTRYFLGGSGGNFLNIFSTPLSRLSMFFSDLLDSVSLAEPRHTSFFVFVSKRSMTRVPTL